MSTRPARPHVGDRPVVFVDCKDTLGNAVDPTDGSLLIEDPSGNVTTVDFASLSVAPDLGSGAITGRVEYTMPVLGEAGRWKLWWQFTAGIEAAEPFTFTVAPQSVTAP